MLFHVSWQFSCGGVNKSGQFEASKVNYRLSKGPYL